MWLEEPYSQDILPKDLFHYTFAKLLWVVLHIPHLDRSTFVPALWCGRRWALKGSEGAFPQFDTPSNT